MSSSVDGPEHHGHASAFEVPAFGARISVSRGSLLAPEHCCTLTTHAFAITVCGMSAPGQTEFALFSHETGSNCQCSLILGGKYACLRVPTLRGGSRPHLFGRLTDEPLMDVLGDQEFAEAPLVPHNQCIRPFSRFSYDLKVM